MMVEKRINTTYCALHNWDTGRVDVAWANKTAEGLQNTNQKGSSD